MKVSCSSFCQCVTFSQQTHPHSMYYLCLLLLSIKTELHISFDDYAVNESDSSVVVCVVLSTESDDCRVDFQFDIMVSTADETASEKFCICIYVASAQRAKAAQLR